VTTIETVPHLLTIDQLAEHLGITTRHVRRLIAERRIPYVKVGGLVRFDSEEIRSWIDANRHAQQATRSTFARRPGTLPAASGHAQPSGGVRGALA
jgi:excisionase family DNA binding protein